MKDVSTYRRMNFQNLVERLGGPRMTAHKLDMNESQVSQLISPTILKTMGRTLARNIEKKAKLPPGSLDMPVSSSGRNLIIVPIMTLDEISTDPDFFGTIAAFTVMQDTDSENKLDQRPYVIWDNTNPHKPQGSLFAMYAPDDALASNISERDLVILDSGIKRPKPGSIVLVKLNGDNTVLRMLRQTPSGYELIAASDLYAPWAIKNLDGLCGVMVEARWYRPRIGGTSSNL